MKIRRIIKFLLGKIFCINLFVEESLMKNYIIRFICIVFFMCFITNITQVKSNTNLNNCKFFLRVSEKYDNENKSKWEKIIEERNNILKYVKGNDKYEEYKSYINKNKKLIHVKRKYVNRLNYSMENFNEYKIKRYLKVILNIFEEENENLKKYFNIN